MSDLILKLVSDHGIGAIIGIASIGIQLWMARGVFANLAAQNAYQISVNRDIARLLERNGMDSIPPPIASTEKHGRLFPRTATPLPFWPIDASKEEKDA